MSVEFEEFTLSDREIQAVIVKVAADVAFLREQFHRWAPLLERLETPMGAIGATRRLRRNAVP